jgi:hypothetical protein
LLLLLLLLLVLLVLLVLLLLLLLLLLLWQRLVDLHLLRCGACWCGGIMADHRAPVAAGHS